MWTIVYVNTRGLGALWVALLMIVFGQVSVWGQEVPEADRALANVNGQSITADRLGFAPGYMPSLEEITAALRNAVREQLIHEQAERAGYAISNRLIDMANANRKGLISRAYLDDQLNRITPVPTDAEVEAFARENPHFLTDRKIYRFTEFTLLTQENSVFGDLVEKMRNYDRSAERQHENVRKLIDWSRSRGFNSRYVTVSRASEEMDPEVFSIVSKLDEEGYRPIAEIEKGRVRVFLFHHSMPEPVRLEDVRESIRMGLYKLERNKQADLLYEQLVAGANVRIFDDRINYAALVAPRAVNEGGGRVSAPAGPVEIGGFNQLTRWQQLAITVWMPFAVIVSIMLSVRAFTVRRYSVARDKAPALAKAWAVMFPVLCLAFVMGMAAYAVYISDTRLEAVLVPSQMPRLLAGVLGAFFVGGVLILLGTVWRPASQAAWLLSLISVVQAAIAAAFVFTLG